MSLQALIEKMKEEAGCYENVDDIRVILQAAEVMREALERYKDGRAFDFDRSLRGEVHFNSSLSSATSRDALSKADDLCKECV